MFSITEKARKIKQFSFCSWRWMGKEVQWNEKCMGTVLLPLLRWPISDPLVQKKCVFGLAILANICSVVSAKFGRVSETICFLFTKSRQATQKHKSEDGRGRRNIFRPFFEDPDFQLRVAIWRLETRKTRFPAVLGISVLHLKLPASHPLKPIFIFLIFVACFCFFVQVRGCNITVFQARGFKNVKS